MSRAALGPLDLLHACQQDNSGLCQLLQVFICSLPQLEPADFDCSCSCLIMVKVALALEGCTKNPGGIDQDPS